MPSTLGIKIDGMFLTDTQVKVLVYFIYGLTYNEIELVDGTNEKTVRNIISHFYCTLGLEGPNDLLRKVHAYGFDFYGYVYGRDMLSSFERKRLYLKIPRLCNEKKLPAQVYD